MVSNTWLGSLTSHIWHLLRAPVLQCPYRILVSILPYLQNQRPTGRAYARQHFPVCHMGISNPTHEHCCVPYIDVGLPPVAGRGKFILFTSHKYSLSFH